jgi:GxxExxY protein
MARCLSGEKRRKSIMQRRYVTRDNSSQFLEKDLTDRNIAAAIEVHKTLGPGSLESAYQLCMAHESKFKKLPFEQQVVVKVNDKELELDGGYRLDFVYDNRVIVELKTVESVIPVHEAQLLTYLKLTGFVLAC